MRYSNDENDDDSTDFLQDPLSPFHDDADDDDAYNDDVYDESDDENDDDGADFLQDPLSSPASIHPASPLRLKRAAKTSLGKNVHERQLIRNSKKIPQRKYEEKYKLKVVLNLSFSLTKESVGEYCYREMGLRFKGL